MSRIEFPSFSQKRRLLDTLLRVPFPMKIDERGNGLARAKELHDNGRGILFTLNHESKRDSIDGIHIVSKLLPFLRDDKCVSAMAYHQAQVPHQKWLNEHLAPWLGIEVMPVVTPHTIELEKSDGLPNGWGLKKFIQRTIEVLRNGGVAGLAPRAERRNFAQDIRLIHDNPKKTPPTLGLFFYATDEADFDDFAVLPLGILRPRSGEFNPFRKDTLIVGDIYTKQEVIKAVRRNMFVPGNLRRSISAWNFLEIDKLLH